MSPVAYPGGYQGDDLRNNNWLIWVIVLFFGWSVAGIVAALLVGQFGFPYTWITPLTLAMIGTVVFLVYRGYPIQAWVLAGCAGWIVISALAVLRAATIRDPHIPEVYRQEFDAMDRVSVLGFDIPLYDSSAIDNYIEYRPDQTTYLLAQSDYETRTPITVAFPPLSTPGGQWAFKSGSLRLRGGMSATFEADPSLNWLSTGEAEFDFKAAPRIADVKMVVSVPLPSNPPPEPFQAEAALTLIYPQSDGSTQESTLSRQFALSFVGDDYYTYYDRYTSWQRSRRALDLPFLALLVVGCVVAGVVGVIMVRQGALQYRNLGGGLSLVIRRLSGSERLGAELLKLDQFRDLTGAAQGVFVGRVTAQSPAGRAGFRSRDVLIELAGKPTNTPAAASRIAKSCPKGQLIKAVVLRDGMPVDLWVRF